MEAHPTHTKSVASQLALGVLMVVVACDRPQAAARLAGATIPWSDSRDSLATEPLSDDAGICADCIGVAKVAELGALSNGADSYVQPTFAILRDGRGNYWLNQGHNLKVFGANGQFVRVVGRPGSGPLEWGNPMPMSSDAPGNVHIVDKGNQRETVVGPDFQRVSDRPMPAMDVQHVASLGADGYVVNAWGTTPARVAQPLHVIRGGEAQHSFGASRSGEPVTPYNARRVIAADRDGHVFSVPDYDYTIEAWTEDGQRILGVAGPSLNRQPVKQGMFNRDDNPVPNQIQSMQADEVGRLWVLSWHVIPGWQDKLEDHVYSNGRTGLVPKAGVTASSLYFSRIEVVDLGAHRIVARVDHPGMLMGWAGPGVLWENRFDDAKPGIWIWQVSSDNSALHATGVVASRLHPLQ